MELHKLEAAHPYGHMNNPYHYADERSVYCSLMDENVGIFKVLFSDERGIVDNSDKHITKKFVYGKLSTEEKKMAKRICKSCWLVVYGNRKI